MGIQGTSQVIAVTETVLSRLTIVSALISLPCRTLQERNDAAPRIALGIMPSLARDSDS